jgi:hypothetical protein
MCPYDPLHFLITNIQLTEIMNTLREKLSVNGAVPANWKDFEGWKLELDGRNLRVVLPPRRWD